MAITNYGQLKTELNVRLFHQRFVAQYDNATTMFEAAANRRLRVRQMEAVTGITTLNGDDVLPPDYLLWRVLLFTMPSPAVELDYVHPAFLESTRVGTTGSNPQIFTIEEEAIRIRPIHDCDAYELHYYTKIPTIVGDDLNTNWLLLAYPDVYVAGVLTELFVINRNPEQTQLEKARRDEMFAEIIQLSALTTGATSSKVRTAEYF